jgi:hypothetical protein
MIEKGERVLFLLTFGTNTISFAPCFLKKKDEYGQIFFQVGYGLAGWIPLPERRPVFFGAP